ncbi:MAG: translation initiation factor eIF-2B [Methanobacteriota archaeon]|nr:MAG: translation initiation factor eIF-2B [Euryarchaeota archaeon]
MERPRAPVLEGPRGGRGHGGTLPTHLRGCENVPSRLPPTEDPQQRPRTRRVPREDGACCPRRLRRRSRRSPATTRAGRPISRSAPSGRSTCSSPRARRTGPPSRSSRSWPAFVGAMQRDLEEGRRKAGRNFVKLLERPATILTLSRSTNVFECLVAAHQKGLVQEALVLESRPLLEGVELARDLHGAGVPVAVITDGAAGAFVAGATLGLTGADTVFLDGSVVNRSGTHALAALCRAAGKPFYAACETFKIDTTRSARDWRPPPDEDPRQVAVDLPARNPIFDLTPATLVTGVVTERGVFKPEMIRQAFGRPSGSER